MGVADPGYLYWSASYCQNRQPVVSHMSGAFNHYIDLVFLDHAPHLIVAFTPDITPLISEGFKAGGYIVNSVYLRIAINPEP